MKVVDANWEKENILKKTIEITFDNNEDKNIIKSRVNEIIDGYEYIVIKSPIGRIDINKYLSTIGFYFVESQLSLKKLKTEVSKSEDA